jgi:opacity protein-like surface antigen
MKRTRVAAIVAAAVVIAAGAASSAAAAENTFSHRGEIAFQGGVESIDQNDTAIPDAFVNIPAVATLTYRLSDLFALEGEFTWLIPVEQNISPAPGVSEMHKSPDILAYQANVRAAWPLTNWSPYLAAGAGAITFLGNTDPRSLPQVTETQTMFGINFGAGALYQLGRGWGLRADVRELAAFPASDAPGLSTAGSADAIWMERWTLGLAYRF